MEGQARVPVQHSLEYEEFVLKNWEAVWLALFAANNSALWSFHPNRGAQFASSVHVLEAIRGVDDSISDAKAVDSFLEEAIYLGLAKIASHPNTHLSVILNLAS
ncbi:hypothetical protein KW797_00140 [Candidatus Parcubacteria bacterium]|nr:hypothetical protein [Candidatus Parcubacteria bacterium]